MIAAAYPRMVASLRGQVALDDEELQELLSSFKEASYPKGHKLLRADEVCEQIWFLEEGLVRHFMVEKDREICTLFEGEGDWVTSYSSFLNQSPSWVTIEALEPLRVMEIDYYRLEALYQKSHKVERIGRLLAQFNYIQLMAKYKALLSFSPEERYDYALERFPKLVNRIALRYLASFLGITPESLSRIRRRITKQKVPVV